MNSTISSQLPIQDPSSAPTLQFAGGMLTWEAVPGAEKYQVFSTAVGTGPDAPFPTQDFPFAPDIADIADPAITSVSIAGGGDVWYGVSVVMGGKNVMFHPILPHTSSNPAVDVVVQVPKRVNVTIPATKTEVTKTLTVTVRNADTAAHDIGLSVDASDCPANIAGAPDFIPSTAVADTHIVVPAGKTKAAKLRLTFRSTDFKSFNFKAPQRCTLVLSADLAAGGNSDPNPSNNVATVELNVVDKNDPEQTAKHETVVQSPSPVLMSVSAGKTTKTLRVTVGNADYRPSVESPGDAITLAATSNCAGLSLSTPACDSKTSSSTVTVRGGTTKTCKITATVDQAQISTPNKLSPRRCMVSLTATGSTNPETAPLDASNNTSQLPIDVLDKGD